MNWILNVWRKVVDANIERCHVNACGWKSHVGVMWEKDVHRNILTRYCIEMIPNR